MKTKHVLLMVALLAVPVWAISSRGEEPLPELKVRATTDFEITGTGMAEEWKKTEWEPIPRRTMKGLEYNTKMKVLYSKKGMYFLMEGTDRKLTSTFKEPYSNLWEEDVFEVFLWTDERDPVYFEYEISPLNVELPIIIPNLGGKFFGWLPWRYEGNRKIRKATSAIEGEVKSGAAVQGWRAEFFIPYDLFIPLRNVPPKPGTKWRANFYRVDHDEAKVTRWEWAPVQTDFHAFKKFGVIVFE